MVERILRRLKERGELREPLRFVSSHQRLFNRDFPFQLAVRQYLSLIAPAPEKHERSERYCIVQFSTGQQSRIRGNPGPVELQSQPPIELKPTLPRSVAETRPSSPQRP